MPQADVELARLIDQIRAAAASRTALRIKGGGSKDFYGYVNASAQILSTQAYAGITSYEPSELVITARAGTPLAELEAALADQGQCLPFEPPHYQLPVRGAGATSVTAISTFGGMVAAGLSGPARASVGSVRDFVLGTRLLNGRAEHLTFGGQVIKNVAGYDVSRLLAGSMGLLGLITEASIKVLPIAPAEATLKFVLDEATAITKLNQWGGKPLPLNASSWVVDAGQPTLYLRLRGAVAAVQAACQQLLLEVPGQRVDSPQTSADWTAARDLRLPWFADGFARGDDLWRLSVPQSAPPLSVGDTMIDWHGGQRWVWAQPGDAPAAARLRQAAQAAKGHASIFVANNRANTGAIDVFDLQNAFQPLSPVLLKIHQQLKAEFDPAGIFNSGRLFANL
jgi:glycolate oxidase FAD binding subunit